MCMETKSSILQEDSEADENTAEDGDHAHTSTWQERRHLGSSLRRAGGRGRGLTTETSNRDLACGRGSSRGGGYGGRKGCVALVGTLSTTGMVLAVETRSAMSRSRVAPRSILDVPAVALASVVALAGSNTLVTPGLADEERECLRVLCDVGNDAILTHAGVGQGISVAVVLLGAHGGDTGLLEADEGALSPVLITPVFCVVLARAVR